MSAYIVDKNHVLYILAAISSRAIQRGSGFSYYHNGERHRVECDPKSLAELGNLLWRENIASVSHRYPGESSATLPGPRDGLYSVAPADIARHVWTDINPGQVLKACDCFEYQSCEHSEWPNSEAKAIIDDLRSAAWHSLPGYDKAAWGAPEPRPGAINLSMLLCTRK
jgi:hypothetical protein